MKKFNLGLLLLPLLLVSCGEKTSSVTPSSATSSAAPVSSSVAPAASSVSEVSSTPISSAEEVSSEEASSSAGDGVYTFEAEWSEGIDEMTGYGYSGTVTGLNLIQPDPGNKGASNGYYVSYLYNEGQTLTWHVNSSADVKKVKFVARFACEYMNISFTSTEYMIKINGTPMGYQTISMTGVDSSAKDKMIPFADFTLNENVSLKEGENTIEFITNNSNKMMGTMYATAPLVDCFKLTTTNAVLSYNPETSNTDD